MVHLERCCHCYVLSSRKAEKAQSVSWTALLLPAGRLAWLLRVKKVMSCHADGQVDGSAR